MNRRVLMVDHVDSFTFNLVQSLRALGAQVETRRADELILGEAREIAPTHLVLSPGPGHPRAAILAQELVAYFGERIPILGVCLGHQILGLRAGARVVPAVRKEHGVEIRVFHDGSQPYHGLPNPFTAGRYHSLVVEEESLSGSFEVSAWSDEGEVLGIRHRSLPIHGIQVHPESVLTPRGDRVLANFLSLTGALRLSGASASNEADPSEHPPGPDSSKPVELPA